MGRAVVALTEHREHLSERSALSNRAGREPTLRDDEVIVLVLDGGGLEVDPSNLPGMVQEVSPHQPLGGQREAIRTGAEQGVVVQGKDRLVVGQPDVVDLANPCEHLLWRDIWSDEEVRLRVQPAADQRADLIGGHRGVHAQSVLLSSASRRVAQRGRAVMRREAQRHRGNGSPSQPPDSTPPEARTPRIAAGIGPAMRDDRLAPTEWSAGRGEAHRGLLADCGVLKGEVAGEADAQQKLDGGAVRARAVEG